MSNYFENIIGNNNLKKKLTLDIDNNFLNHAYIIEGENLSGRHTIITSLAAAISCKNKNDKSNVPCKVCSNCKKIFEQKCPDIINVGLVGDKVYMGVDSIRFIKSDIAIEPNDLEKKFYIIENADLMTIQAQNALLLSLEEPPPYVMFFLVCQSQTSLLETIKSRATTLSTQKIDTQQISDYLLENSKTALTLKNSSPEEYSEILIASGGSIGQALQYLEPKKRKLLLEQRNFTKKFITTACSGSTTKTLEVLSEFGSKRNDIISSLLLVQTALRDLILLKKSEFVALCFYSDYETASELSTHFTLQKLFCIYDAIEIAIEHLLRNTNVKITLMNMFSTAKLL